MLDLVDIGERTLESYRGIAPDEQLDDLRRAAADLRGVRVLHVNATPYGGGVSELLRSEVPLLNDLGLVADWRIITGDTAFFEVTKKLHNGLQGASLPLTDAEEATYLAHSRINAAAFGEDYDFVFIHDPQPAALLPLRGKGNARWIWRCHIDTSIPDARAWAFLRPFLVEYDAAIFTMAGFVPPDLPVHRVEVAPPAIDPLSPKNLPLAPLTARQVLEWIGIRLRHPLVTQISRFDPWKDPEGVIAAYRLARREFPELQLALVGSLALDDPEGREMYRRIQAEVREDRLIHLFTNLVGVGNVEVNAFQTLSNVVVQKSIREGFGLVVSESLWKGTPVVAGRSGGIPLQMADGAGGLLVDSVEECAAGIVAFLHDAARGKALAAQGRARVRTHFLLPRLLLDELLLMRQLSAVRPIARAPDWFENRDPVCGMALAGPPPVQETYRRTSFGFCSQYCRSIFREDPAHYLRARHLAEAETARPGPGPATS